MNKFEYNLPSGAKFVVTAPPGTTQEQADLIFYSQVASGALVGYQSGQTLSTVTVTPLTNELSRQSRGTAGVPGTLSGVYNNRNDIVRAVYNATLGGYYGVVPSNGGGGGGGGGDGTGGGDTNPPFPPWPPRPPYPPFPPRPPLPPNPPYPPFPPNPPRPPRPPKPPGPPGPGPVDPVLPPGPGPADPIPPLPAMPPIIPVEPPAGRDRPINDWGSILPMRPITGALVESIYSQTEAPPGGFDGYLSPSEIQYAASILAKYPAINAMPDLTNVPVVSPVDQADIILAKGNRLGAEPVGILTPFQVQTLQAQMAALVNQPSEEITQEKGVGKFGLSCYQLEKAGYVKPGTSARFVEPSESEFIKIMNSPAIWTGKNGVRTLDAYLAAERYQNSSCNMLMNQGYSGLQASGVIEAPPQREVTYDTAWIYTDSGLQPLGASSVFLRDENGTIGTGTFSAVPTTYFATLDSGVTTEDATTNEDLASYNFNALKKNVVNELTNNTGALVMASGKFGPEPASLWAGTGTTNNLEIVARAAIDTTNNRNILLNQLGGAASLYNGSISTTNPITSLSVNTVSDSFTSFARNSLSQNYSGVPGGSGISPSVTDQLIVPVTQIASSMNTYGKAAQFAMNFVNQSIPTKEIISFVGASDIINGLAGSGSITDNLINGLAGSGSILNGNISGIIGSDISGLLGGDVSGILNGGLSGVFNQLPGLGNFNMSSIASIAGAFGSFGSILGALQIFGNLFGGNNIFTSGIELGIGYSDTVDRDTVDSSCQRLLSNPKIPQPIYGYPGDFWLKIIMDLARANSQLSDAAKLGDAFVAGISNTYYTG